MKKTFLDCILECESYPYSQEKYEIMKECSELALMEQYMDSQQFMAEHTELFSESVNIQEGFLMESADEGSLEVITEKADTKAKSLRARIVNGFMRIINAFKNLIAKIQNKFDSTTKEGQKVVHMLKKHEEFSDAQVAEIQRIVDAAKKKYDGFVPRTGQPYLSKVTMKTSSTDEKITALRNDLAAALSDTKVVAEVGMTKNGAAIGALPIETIRKALLTTAVGGTGELKGVVTNLTTAWGKAQKDGITIMVNTDQINKAHKDLQEILDSFNQEVKKYEDKAKNAVAIGAAAAGVDKDDAKKIDAMASQAFSEIYGMAQATIGASMRLYSGLNGYRSAVISGVKKYLETGKGATAAEKAVDAAKDAAGKAKEKAKGAVEEVKDKAKDAARDGAAKAVEAAKGTSGKPEASGKPDSGKSLSQMEIPDQG